MESSEISQLKENVSGVIAISNELSLLISDDNPNHVLLASCDGGCPSSCYYGCISGCKQGCRTANIR